jgi:hypothetical protein
LIQLTDASRSAHILGPGDVQDILRHSQRNHTAAGVTGALCLTHGLFLPQLDGDRGP